MDNQQSHPIQPLETDENGRKRFKENKIVSHLLSVATRHGAGLNDLAVMDFTREDREQFAQLIGYSASGFCDLSYVRLETIKAVNLMAESDQDAVVAENQSLKKELRQLKEQLKPLVSDLYGIHPDDLD